MSGGQKQRVSLARALYSRARHLLLDDCLSAVDSHTAKWIFEEALTGPIVQDRTRILVTHNISLCLPSAAHVVLLDNGRVSAQGLPQALIDQGALGHDDDALINAVSLANSRVNSRVPSRVPSKTRISDIVEEQEGAAKMDAAELKKKEAREASANLTQEETRAKGSVKWQVYGAYTSSLGGLIFWLLIVAAFICQQGFNILQTYWIREWSMSYSTKDVLSALYYGTPKTSLTSKPAAFFLPNTINAAVDFTFQSSSPSAMIESVKKNSDLNYYLGVYALIALAYCVVTFFRIIVVSLGSLRASRVLHEKLLHKVVYSKMRFFDSTPMGRIMNRYVLFL